MGKFYLELFSIKKSNFVKSWSMLYGHGNDIFSGKESKHFMLTASEGFVSVVSFQFHFGFYMALNINFNIILYYDVCNIYMHIIFNLLI